MSAVEIVSELALKARTAARTLSTATGTERKAALYKIAEAIESRSAEILKANGEDIARAQAEDMHPQMQDRLLLNESRVAAIANGARLVADLPDPLGQVLRHSTLPNGLDLKQISVPFGVIGMVYEARPNVTVDAAVILLMSGNTALLRGSADLLVLISDVDALYDAPPSQPGAKAIHFVDRISDIESIEIGGAGSAGVGSGGMVTKIEAARISTSAGIPMLLTSLAKSPGALAGEEAGTFFAAHGTRSNSRLLWLAHASTPRGRLILDAGAVTAIKERGVSLLPAGVTAVEGEFISGDTVELVGIDNKVIARGLVAFDSDEIPQMLGRSTKELAAALGAEFERELVHRDDLVLLG